MLRNLARAAAVKKNAHSLTPTYSCTLSVGENVKMNQDTAAVGRNEYLYLYKPTVQKKRSL